MVHKWNIDADGEMDILYRVVGVECLEGPLDMVVTGEAQVQRLQAGLGSRAQASEIKIEVVN